MNYVYCAPHTFHLSDGAGDVRRMLEYAGDRTKHLHIADCYNHKPGQGHRYIVNPPGSTPASTSTTRSGTATSTGTSSSAPSVS